VKSLSVLNQTLITSGLVEGTLLRDEQPPVLSYGRCEEPVRVQVVKSTGAQAIVVEYDKVREQSL